MSIKCGLHRAIALTNDGVVVEWELPLLKSRKRAYTKLDGITQLMCSTQEGPCLQSGHVQFRAAVRTDGTLFTWGNGERGQLGQGRSVEYQYSGPDYVAAPVEIPGHLFGAEPVASVACGCEFTLVVTQPGGLFSFGLGDRGQLGHGDDGGNATRLAPTRVEALVGTHITMAAAGDRHSLVVAANGCMWSFGFNHSGQLGVLGDDAHQSAIPLPVEGFGMPSDMVYVAAGNSHSMAITAGGKLYAWGNNDYGQLGLGYMRAVYTPVLVCLEEGLGDADGGGRHAPGPSNSQRRPLAPTPTPVRDDEILEPVEAAEGDNEMLEPVEGAEGGTMLKAAVLAKMVDCDDRHCMCVTLAGDVYWTGHLPAPYLTEQKSWKFQRPFVSKTVNPNMANIFTRVKSHIFEHSRIASVSTFRATSMALSENGTVYLWDHFLPLVRPTVLGLDFFTEAVGLYAKMSQKMVLALAMGTHSRLGAAVDPPVDAAAAALYDAAGPRRKSKRNATNFSRDHRKGCPFSDLHDDLIHRLVETVDKSFCGSHTEGVTRLMGGPANARKPRV